MSGATGALLVVDFCGPLANDFGAKGQIVPGSTMRRRVIEGAQARTMATAVVAFVHEFRRNAVAAR